MYKKLVIVIIVVLAILGVGMFIPKILVQPEKPATSDSQNVNSTQINNTASPNTSVIDYSSEGYLSGEELAKFQYDKNTLKTYKNLDYGFSFDYPKDWNIEAGADVNNAINTGVIFRVLLTKNYATAGQQKIEIYLSVKENWKQGGGEGTNDQFIQMKNLITKEAMYFNLYNFGDSKWFYDHIGDTKYQDKARAEVDTANEAFKIVIKSFKAQ